MAFTRTMSQIIGLCKRRSDKEDDLHIDDDEWKELISELYGELHGAVTETGARYFESEITFTADGSASYPLPADHFSTIGVDLVESGGRRTQLAELMMQERDVFSGQTGKARFFSHTGATISLYPKPSSGTYELIYVAQPTNYSATGDSTSIDVINNDGLKFIVWGVASIALHKSEADQQRAMIERDAARARLVSWAVNRALLMPKRRVVTETELSSGTIPGNSPASWLYR
jgi:hypothetical protein